MACTVNVQLCNIIVSSMKFSLMYVYNTILMSYHRVGRLYKEGWHGHDHNYMIVMHYEKPKFSEYRKALKLSNFHSHYLEQISYLTNVMAMTMYVSSRGVKEIASTPHFVFAYTCMPLNTLQRLLYSYKALLPKLT